MGNWLSELRNQVNYQHVYGAWFPHDMGPENRRLVESAKASWKKASDTFSTDKVKEMELFFESTSLVLALLREMLGVCVEKAGHKKSVFHDGALRVLRTVGAE